MTTTFEPRGRLPVSVQDPRARRGERMRGAAAVLGTFVAVVGVPALLVLLVSNPLPTSLPSSQWLTAEISTEVVLKAVALVVWAVWVHFVVCLVVELVAARRGSGLPATVPFGGGSQAIARKLVAAALLVAGTATLAPTGTSAPVQVAGISAAAEDAWGSRYQAQADAVAQSQAAAEAAATEQAGTAAATQAEVYYTVQPPNGRNHDTLWDIAERTLGDPLRYREIHAMNLDRVQPDGRRLVDADLIFPGWVLQMPADASGPGLSLVQPITAPVAPAVTAEPGPTSATAAEAGATGGATAEAGGATVAAGATETVATAGESTELDRLALGGGLLVAGVLLALSGRRGPYRAPSEQEERLRLAAGTRTADLLDRSLRHLAAGRAAQALPLPEVVLAYADEQQVVLHLSGAEGSPGLSSPPSPWAAGENGRSWTLAGKDLDGLTTPDLVAPYPALVNVASAHGFELLVDLEAVPGVVSVGGDTSLARDVVASMAVELASNVWSDGVQVTLVGFGDDLVEIAPDHLEQVAELGPVLDEVERGLHGADELARALGVQGVLDGRMSRSGDRFRPRVLVLSSPPSPAEAARLQQHLGSGRTPLAAVCVGDSPLARMRFVVDAGGGIDLGALGVRGTARTLAPAQYREVTGLLRELDEVRAERSVEVASMSTAAGLAEAGPVAAPSRRPVVTDAAVQVRLLGPVDVVAPGRLDDRQRGLLTSVVVTVAMAPEGLHDGVLRATIWPRGVSDEVVASTIGAVRAWLGRDEQGRERLAQGADGRWRLGDDVACDTDSLAHVAAGDAGDLDAQLAVLSTARGELFSGRGGERFSSFAFARNAQQARVLVTTLARQAAATAGTRGRPDLAETALRKGLVLVPTAEPLWRDLLRVVGTAGAAEVAQEMYGALDRHRARPEPETDALVEQLVPGGAGPGRSGTPRKMA
jgi:hypothetical protein